MIEEQKDFKDLFNTNGYYVLSRSLDDVLLQKGFTYSHSESSIRARTLVGYCVIAGKDCKIIFSRKNNEDKKEENKNVSLEIVELEKTRMFGHLINGILDMTTNELENKILKELGVDKK